MEAILEQAIKEFLRDFKDFIRETAALRAEVHGLRTEFDKHEIRDDERERDYWESQQEIRRDLISTRLKSAYVAGIAIVAIPILTELVRATFEHK